ncbi:Acyl carrier protein [Streptomyces hundungensis]|uniref:Acyl carrier protein n=1 Tax=Streptomyces hundungensis TaxID=1077946 RepID=A0A387HP83_9ACTN|nr:hypothetical protein [Streptomyces hundungensis]AYG84621.1 Acyl carrier protein [Streptomyces hundungensis]
MAHTESSVRDSILSLVRQLAPDGEDMPTDRPAHLVNDLGYHSLALLELAFAIEDDFDLPPIDEETGRSIVTSEDVVAYVLTQLREQKLLVG